MNVKDVSKYKLKCYGPCRIHTTDTLDIKKKTIGTAWCPCNSMAFLLVFSSCRTKKLATININIKNNQQRIQL